MRGDRKCGRRIRRAMHEFNSLQQNCPPQHPCGDGWLGSIASLAPLQHIRLPIEPQSTLWLRGLGRMAFVASLDQHRPELLLEKLQPLVGSHRQTRERHEPRDRADSQNAVPHKGMKRWQQHGPSHSQRDLQPVAFSQNAPSTRRRRSMSYRITGKSRASVRSRRKLTVQRYDWSRLTFEICDLVDSERLLTC